MKRRKNEKFTLDDSKVLSTSEQENREPTREDALKYLYDKVFLDAIRTKSSLVAPTEAEINHEYIHSLAVWTIKEYKKLAI